MAATKRSRPPKPRRGEAAFDRWSWVHLGSGVALFMVGVPTFWAVGLIVGFEALEAGLRRFKTTDGGGLFEYESWPNVAVDLVVGLGGYALAWALHAPHATWLN